MNAAQAILTETQQRTTDLETREREVADQLAIVNLSQAEQLTRREKLEGEIEMAASTLTRTQEEIAANRRHAAELRESGEAASTRLEELTALVKTHEEAETAAREAVQKSQTEFLALEEELRQARRSLLDINNPAPAMHDLTNSGVAYESMQQVVREVIKIVDFTDMAHTFVKTNDKSSVSGEQFMLLRQALVGLLNNLNVEEVAVDPGTTVDRAMRSRIQVMSHVDGDAEGTVTRIHSMLAPGYARLNASGKQVFLRKPEVITTTGNEPERTEEVLSS